MEYINTSIAAQMLRVSQRRVLYLLQQQRIKGAYKKRTGWVIPLYKGKPKVSRGTRGPKPRWSTTKGRGPRIIYVNKNHITTNEKRIAQHGAEVPLKTVVSVRHGTNKTVFGHELEIFGYCQIVYCPEQPQDCGASLWIKTYSDVKVVDKSNPDEWSFIRC
ncbi:MAG: hypothetical protein WA865_21290 [Spirulinaceae cyanobacterium]